MQLQARPSAAIIHIADVPKIWGTNDCSKQNRLEYPKLIYDISALINALDNTFCFPGLQTTYPMDSVPLGPFGGSGGGSQSHDILPESTSKLLTADLDTLRNVLSLFGKLSVDERSRLHLILHRLGSAKARRNAGDQALDLGICAEMMLLGGDHGKKELPDSLSHRLRTRGAWLLGKNPSEREYFFNKLRDVYTARSQVAHNGKLNKSTRLTKEHFYIVSRIARRLIEIGGVPSYDKWLKITLGDDAGHTIDTGSAEQS